MDPAKQYINVRSQKSAKSAQSRGSAIESQNSDFVASASRNTPYDANYTKRTISSNLDSRNNSNQVEPVIRGRSQSNKNDISRSSLNRSLKSLRSKSSYKMASSYHKGQYKKATVSSSNKMVGGRKLTQSVHSSLSQKLRSLSRESQKKKNQNFDLPSSTTKRPRKVDFSLHSSSQNKSPSFKG